MRSNCPPSLMSVLPIHTSALLERARQSTRIRKRKVDLANKKKKEERLRKNPPPIPYKVQLMLRAKGFGSKPLAWRAVDTRPFPTDDVWSEKDFTWRRLSVNEVGMLQLVQHNPAKAANSCQTKIVAFPLTQLPVSMGWCRFSEEILYRNYFYGSYEPRRAKTKFQDHNFQSNFFSQVFSPKSFLI